MRSSTSTIADYRAPLDGAANVSADRNGHAPHKYEAIPLPSVEAAEHALIGVALGRSGDPLVKARADYRELIAAVGLHEISESSFHLPGLGRAFMAALDQRAGLDGERADVRLVHARLIREADAEGAHHAYGIDVYRHLEKWAEEAPPGANADFYAWAVARHARARVVDGALETARGDRSAGVDPVVVARRLAATLAGIDAPSGDPDTALTRAEEEAFWNSRPELQRIRQFAWARMANPWATLGCVLIRVLAQVRPDYVLPAIIGGEVSLNLYAAIVAESGDGKNAAMAAAAALLRVDSVPKWPIGTGEGIVKHFVHSESDGEGTVRIVQHETSCLVDCSEVDKLDALKRRTGSTVMTALRDAWMGDEMGYGNSELDRRLKVLRHAYRMGFVIGVQPERGATLLSEAEAAGGTPQRFLWFPGTDPLLPDFDVLEPDGMRWEVPTWPEEVKFYNCRGESEHLHALDVCATARTAIKENRRRRSQRRPGAVNGHHLLCREKVAAALGLLFGHVRITEEDWRLAGVVMRVSDHTRGTVLAAIAVKDGRENRKRAEARADATVLINDRVDADGVQKASKAVLTKLRKLREERGPEAWMTGGELTRGINYRHRDFFDQATSALVATGQVEGEPVQGGGTEGMRYRLR